MLKDYEKLFTHIDYKEPPSGLLDKIILHIYSERRRQVLRTRIVLFGTLSFVAIAALVPAWQGLQSGISQSGFLQFISLIFSDSAVVITYWQNFALSLLESLPALEAAAVLGAIFAFLFSLKFLIRDINAMFKLPALIRVNN